MTTEKAIEILTGMSQPYEILQVQDCVNAIRLSIAALKRVKHVRDTYQKTSYVLLPGETKE